MSFDLSDRSSLSSSLATRKEYDFAQKKIGKEGRQIPIEANYFRLKIETGIIYHYNVEIKLHDFVKESGDKNVPQRNKMFAKHLLKDNHESIFDRFVKQETGLFSSEPVYDGKKNLYSRTRLSITGNTTFLVKQKIPERKFPTSFDVIITIPPDSHELNLDILNDSKIKNAQNELQALEIIMSFGLKKHRVSIGSNLFPRYDDLLTMSRQQREAIRFELPELKEACFGHYQSVKLTEMGPQLNVDRVAAVFHKGGSLINLIEKLCTEMRNPKRGNNQPPPRQVVVDNRFSLKLGERSVLNRELKGLSFVVNHISYRPKNTIFAITEQNVSEIYFDLKTQDSNQTIKTSVKEYFERTYNDYVNQNLGGSLNGNLPCVQVGKNQPKYFPLEVIEICNDQNYRKKLNANQQAEMTTRCAKQRPTERFNELKLQLNNFINRDGYLAGFDIKIKKEFTQVNGRVFEDPSLMFKKESRNPVEVIKKGQWRANPFVVPATGVGRNWLIVNYVRDHEEQLKFATKKDDINLLVKKLLDCSRDQGLDLAEPLEKIYDEEYLGLKDLRVAINEYVKDYPQLRIIIFVIPQIDQLYHEIKYLTELEIGIPSQCVSQSKKNKFSNLQYVSNLLLKINPKLGGSNVFLEPKCKTGHLKKKTMIMGLDVTHPSNNDRLGNSIASLVASYDSKMVNYMTKCVVQPKPKLEIVELDAITKEFLENFREKNNFLPEYILMYRDGVSDGQFNQVVDSEINLIKKACADISPNYNPMLTYIVVQKRHNTRFLPKNPQDRIDKSENVLPGTVIDNTITSGYYSDFYLNHHYGPLGTSRPTRYVVLHDETPFTGDELQRATHLLSYLFPRTTKCTSVVPPVLFAHLAAKRARSYLFILDNNRGVLFGENELTPDQVKDLNAKIIVKDNLKKILYYL